MSKYYEVLSKSWADMATSDYFYKSNSRRKVIEMTGADCPDAVSSDSVIIIMYNVVTGCPLVLTEKFYSSLDKYIMDSMSDVVKEKFNVTIETGEDNNGKFTEIICIRKSFYDSVTESDSPD